MSALKQQNRNRNKTLCRSLCLFSAAQPKALIQIERRTPKRNSPPLSSPPKSSWWFSPQFNSSSRNRPIKVGTESSRLLICPKINRLLGAGGWLWLLWLACLLACRLRWRLETAITRLFTPTTNSVPVDGLAGGYEIDGWMLNDATEQQEGKGGCDEDVC